MFKVLSFPILILIMKILLPNVYKTINIYGYGIQHTCIFYLYSYKNRVLACFQTRPLLISYVAKMTRNLTQCTVHVLIMDYNLYMKFVNEYTYICLYIKISEILLESNDFNPWAKMKQSIKNNSGLTKPRSIIMHGDLLNEFFFISKACERKWTGGNSR